MNKFKQLRKAAGLRQGDVANALKFTTFQLVSNIERGIATYPIKYSKKLSQLFSVPESEIKNEMLKFKVDRIKEKMKF